MLLQWAEIWVCNLMQSIERSQFPTSRLLEAKNEKCTYEKSDSLLNACGTLLHSQENIYTLYMVLT
jgi:hypothetical protein